MATTSSHGRWNWRWSNWARGGETQGEETIKQINKASMFYSKEYIFLNVYKIYFNNWKINYEHGKVTKEISCIFNLFINYLGLSDLSNLTSFVILLGQQHQTFIFILLRVEDLREKAAWAKLNLPEMPLLSASTSRCDKIPWGRSKFTRGSLSEPRC